ncbi:hypothetical protein IQ268_05895 [Oculatella sp. LEGE 06141]|uniref:hypothetical protein n=1 Tax=Oculatella sp. LEGE 06141 TaxID=1828648 RepID=UPI00187F556C|nr:hypothetical protein [Oculatella sp. LEGE 06141]MBE9178118.1 hypothetical protein [Oculatella sp. LEGE 06141]
MTLDEFETEVRDLLERILSGLQLANLITAQESTTAQAEILAVGQLVQELSHTVEEFVEQQRRDRS